MPAIASRNIFALSRDHAPSLDLSPFGICRDCVLPHAGILEQVRAIEVCYLKLTGRTLDAHSAIRVLDRIREDREGTDPYSPRPIPGELAEVACWLGKNGYDPAGIYLAVRAVERLGSAHGTGVIDSEDVEYVQAILARTYTA